MRKRKPEGGKEEYCTNGANTQRQIVRQVLLACCRALKRKSRMLEVIQRTAAGRGRRRKEGEEGGERGVAIRPPCHRRAIARSPN